MTITQQKLSELRRLKDLLEAQRDKEVQGIKDSLALSRYRQIARPQQLPPDGEWFVWLILSGRGWGKTLTGAGWIAEKALSNPDTEWAIVAPTYMDARRTCVEGPSGLLKMLDPTHLEQYNRSNGQITLVNGSKIHMLSADEPDRARGLNLSGAWCDEFAAWRYPETWTEGLVPALRIGSPQVVITTTPRPTKLVREFVGRTDGSIVVTRGSTFDNAANLSPAALAELKARYEGTRIGRQELYGEVLTDTEGALVKQDMIDQNRLEVAPELVRVVVAVDPAVTSGPDSDETGIVVVAKTADGRAVVLADRSCRDTPLGWAKRVNKAYEEFQADRVVAEKNQGGDFIEATLKQVNPLIAFRGVVAKQSKRLRAEPTAALYEQGKVSHVGHFPELEDQLTTWLPDSGESPDRLDALVHGMAELGFASGGAADRYFASIAPPCPYCGNPNASDAKSCRHCGKMFIGSTSAVSTGFPTI
jgi:phage terminase large subunit-like protein